MASQFPTLTARQLKAHLRRHDRQGLALDIDNTLSATDLHWIEVLNKRFGTGHGLSVAEITRKYHWLQHVPGWQSPAVQRAMRRFARSNNFQVTIPLIEDAHHTVTKIHTIVPIVAYVTARPSSVATGTQRWLAKHGFPPAPITFRPPRIRFHEMNAWKIQTLLALSPNIVGLIDDSAGVVGGLVAKKYPGYLYSYGPRAYTKKAEHLFACPSWADVLKAVSKTKLSNPTPFPLRTPVAQGREVENAKRRRGRRARTR